MTSFDVFPLMAEIGSKKCCILSTNIKSMALIRTLKEKNIELFSNFFCRKQLVPSILGERRLMNDFNCNQIKILEFDLLKLKLKDLCYL